MSRPRSGVLSTYRTTLEKIADFDVDAQEWGVVKLPDDPEEVVL